MPSTDVQRLLLQVDASVELARRNMKDLANAVDRDAGQIDNALKRVEDGHKRMGAQLGKTGQFRGGMQQLSFQIGDVTQQMAVGTKASVIFAQQSGQVIQAIQLMNTGTSGFLKFMAGPWGVVLTTAGVVLATFAGKLFDAKTGVADLVGKMREQAAQADLNRQADEAWKHTVEGLTDAIRKRREEQEKSLQTDIQAERQSLKSAEADLAAQRRNKTRLENELKEAQAAQQRTASNPGAGGTGVGGQGVDVAAARVRALQEQLAQVTASIKSAEASVRGAQIPIAERSVESQLDKVAAATNRYTEALGYLRQQLRANNIDQATFERRLRGATIIRDRDIKAAQAAAKPATGLAKVTPGEVGNLLKSEFGGTVTSTTGGKHAKNSYHYAAQAVDFVPAGGMGSISKAQIQAAADAAGIKVLELLGPGDKDHDDHYHVAFAKARLGPDQVARAQAARAKPGERAADLKVDQDDQFASRMQQLEQQALQAQMELVTGIDAQADFAAKQVDAEQKRYELTIQNDVNDHRLREEQGKLLVEKSQAVSSARKANIEAQRMLRHLEDENRTAAQKSEFAIEGLRYQDEIAKTQAEHRRIQLQIIEALYAQREADLHLAKAKAEAAKDAEEAARIQGQIDELPTQRGRDEDRARRDTRSPLDQWRDTVPQTADDMNQFFGELKVQGIEGAINALTALRGGFDDMRDVAVSAIQDIIAQLIRMQLMKAALSIIGGATSVSTGSFASAGAAGPTISTLPGFATGGAFRIGGRPGIDQNILSINDRPVARVGRGEELAVVPQSPNVGVPRPANSNDSRGGGSMVINAPFHNHAPMDRREARQTSLQHGRILRRAIGKASKGR